MQNIKIDWQGAVIFSLFTGFISLKLKEKDEELPTIESEEFSKIGGNTKSGVPLFYLFINIKT